MVSSKISRCLAVALFVAMFLSAAPARAQSNPTSVMFFCGRVTTLNGSILDGIQITVRNLRTGQSASCRTPAMEGSPGTFVLSLQDMGNNSTAQAGDRVTFTVVDLLNRFRRPLRCSPSAFTLLKGDSASMMKRLNVAVY